MASSTQRHFSLAPDMRYQSLIRAYYTNLEFYYEVIPKIVPNIAFGFERVYGNRDTELNINGGENGTPTLDPLDLITKSIGIGVDFNLNRDLRAGLKSKIWELDSRNTDDSKIQGFEIAGVFTYRFSVR